MSVNTVNNQREMTQLNKEGLWFLCMIHLLIVLYDTSSYCAYNCMKFHSNIFNGFQLTAQTRNSIANIIKGK